MSTSAPAITAPSPATATARWQDAIDRLDPDTRAALASVATPKLEIRHLVKAADEKRKIAEWVNHLVAVEDMIVQYDPTRTALP
ncbi:hypothetical protein N7517_006363 [Penicillium concentricum]|uniref:Uncharacterized protein n=1 Tax=Penicillium concentricum TaxID=293559 RepID=A0A9W9SA40_9EURO|nr:uncharacterized protein N7517_006363 [Penicillium concentricum]KAJ5374357.1 hypothetical protein N7517_006363 [Penicillium concentricum]